MQTHTYGFASGASKCCVGTGFVLPNDFFLSPQGDLLKGPQGGEGREKMWVRATGETGEGAWRERAESGDEGRRVKRRGEREREDGRAR